jgi:F-type H+-transporting ATPase subunit alpha
VLRQDPAAPIPVVEQILTLFALTEGMLDEVDLERIAEAEEALREAARTSLGGDDELGRRIVDGEDLDDDARERMRQIAREALAEFDEESDADPGTDS